ncbi:MAG: hypothetical protein ACXWZY_08225 [Gaiellaceae bacterium]
MLVLFVLLIAVVHAWNYAVVAPDLAIQAAAEEARAEASAASGREAELEGVVAQRDQELGDLRRAYEELNAEKQALEAARDVRRQLNEVTTFQWRQYENAVDRAENDYMPMMLQAMSDEERRMPDERVLDTARTRLAMWRDQTLRTLEPGPVPRELDKFREMTANIDLEAATLEAVSEHGHRWHQHITELASRYGD